MGPVEDDGDTKRTRKQPRDTTCRPPGEACLRRSLAGHPLSRKRAAACGRKPGHGAALISISRSRIVQPDVASHRFALQREPRLHRYPRPEPARPVDIASLLHSSR